jgi:hypothetical protein
MDDLTKKLVVLAVLVAAFVAVIYYKQKSAEAEFHRETNAAYKTPSLDEIMKQPATPPASASKGTIKVERVWEERRIAYGYALVSYINDGGATFPSQVSVQCDALDKSGGKIGTNSRSLSAREVGPIGPGYKGTLEIPVELHGARLHSMSCWILRAL